MKLHYTFNTHKIDVIEWALLLLNADMNYAYAAFQTISECVKKAGKTNDGSNIYGQQYIWSKLLHNIYSAAARNLIWEFWIV